MSTGNTTISYTPGGADDPANLFHYMPTMAPAVISLVFYTVSFIILTTFTIWKRTWYMIVLLIGCLMEIIGYATRIPLVLEPAGQTKLYACMHVCLIMAPVFYAAIEYVLFGRLMHAVGDQYSLLKPKLVAWVFIISDVISFFIQAGGAGMLISGSKDAQSAQTAENILLGGLGVNLASFAIFCLLIFVFDYRTRKSPPAFPSGSLCEKGWRQFLYAIYISSFLVLIRQIYRVVEFSQGFVGYLAVHEVYFYIFDTIMIFAAGVIFIICFPGNGYLPANRNDTFALMEDNQHHSRQKSGKNSVGVREDFVIGEKF